MNYDNYYNISKAQLKISKITNLFRLAKWLDLHFDETWSKNQIVGLIWWRITRNRRYY